MPYQDSPTNEQRWPAVHLAYDFVLPSYQLLVSRFEAADNRLSSVMTIASTLTFAAPVLAKSIRPGLAFTSPWFIAAMVLFVVATGLGLSGRLRGGLKLPDPGVIYNRYLSNSDWAFKKDVLYWAAEHFKANAQSINRKSRMTLAVGVGLGFEILALLAWLAR